MSPRSSEKKIPVGTPSCVHAAFSLQASVLNSIANIFYSFLELILKMKKAAGFTGGHGFCGLAI
jgi:hypothetical protein